MATFVAGQPYTGKVIDPSQGGAIVDYKPSTGNTSQALQQQQSGVQLTSPVITPSRLSTKSPYVPATTQDSPIPDLSHLAPVNPADNPANQQSQLTPSESRIKSQIDELMGVNQGLEGKAKDTALYNEQFGVNAASDAITGLNSQLTGLINESKAIPLAIQQNAQVGGANVTKGGLAPIQTAQLRNNAIQSLAVSSQIDAMNGQLSNAIKKVDRAIAYKYADLEARSATLTKNLEILKNDPSLTLEQQDRVDKKLAAQKAYDAQLAQQKKTETDTHDAILKTLSNNSGNPKLTSQVVAALQAAKTPEEVLALENYFGLSSLTQQEKFSQDLQTAKFKQDEKQFGMNYDLQQQKFAEDKRQFDETYKQSQQKIDQAAQATQTDPRQITAYADQYASTGSLTGIPKELVGVVTEAAKEAPKADGVLISKVTGVADAKIPATEQQDFTRLATILKNVQRLEEINKGRIGGLVAGSVGAVSGSQTQAQYLATRKAIVDDISRMQSGAALTADEVAFYEDYLPGRFSDTYVGPFKIGQDSQKKIENFKTIMENRLRDRLDTNNLAIVGFSKVKLDDGNEYTVGQIVTNDQGQRGRVNADGSITIL